MNLFSAISTSSESITAVPSKSAVTYLWFPQEDEDDDDIEIALAAEWTWEGGAGVAAETVWSTEAEGCSENSSSSIS